jgi:hypothetical protein
MKTQHVFSASAAAVLAMTMAAFAQTPQSASPSTQTSEAQASKQPEAPVTLVGCVMREADYRKANDSGRGGALGTGVGRGNEFVLVNAAKVASGATPPASAGECGASAAGEAYELTGSREPQLEKYVSRRVEISGTLKEAKTTGATGEPKPTGGFDPLKQDLKLFEVEVASFREVPAGQSAAALPSAPPAARPAAPAPAPPAQPQPQPQPSPSTAPRQSLPRTASPLPLVGLIGLFSIASGLMLRRRA